MKRFLLLFALAGTIHLQAQQPGSGAAESTFVAKDNSWKNWVFGASAILTAAGGVFAVSVANGSNAH